jgi:hypothetical protein
MPSDGFPRLWPVCLCTDTGTDSTERGRMPEESDRAGGLP